MHTPKQDNITSPPSSPRQWLSAVRDILGHNFFANLFGVSFRTVTRWIAQRPYVAEGSIRENYLEHHETLLNKLMNDGYHDLARSIVSRHADLVGCRMVANDTETPDKADIASEMLDDYPALVRFHESIQSSQDINTVINNARITIDEINETVALYRSQK